MARALGSLWLLAGLVSAAPALCDEVVATGPLAPRPAPPAPAHEIDIDAVGSVRAGYGYSELMRSRILSLSFEDQFRVHRFTRFAGLDLVFGMDGQRPLDSRPAERGFLAITLGPGLVLRDGDGPAVLLSATAAPLLQSRDDHSRLAGFGLGARAEAYPFYLSLEECILSHHSATRRYLLSGLHGWVQTRHDWLGTGGQSYDVGFGFDLGREILLPVLDALLRPE